MSSIEPNDAGDELEGGEEVPSGLLVSGGDRAKLLDLGEEVLDQMARRIKLSVIVARRGPVGPWRDDRGLTSGRQRLRTRVSASKALSAISISASMVGSRRSAPTRSCASPPVRKKRTGLPSASTRAWTSYQSSRGKARGAVTPLGEAVSNSDCFPKLGCRSAGGGLPTQLSLAPCSRPSRPLRVAIAMAATQPVLTAAARDALLLRRVGTEKQRLSRTKKLNCLCIAQDAVALCLS